MPLFGGAMSLLPQLVGSKQLGAAAPAFNNTGSGETVDSGDLLDLLSVGKSETPLPQANPTGGVTDVLAQQPVTSKPSVFNTEAQNQEMNPGFGDKVGGFFDNLDSNLQSPSKQIGLGLLSQIDPRLAGAGLFAGGLFGSNKVF